MLGKVIIVALLAMVLELAHDCHTLAVVRGNTLAAIAIVASMPIIGFLDAHWFIEAATLGRRLLLVAATAAGYAAGTMLVMVLGR